MNRHRQINKLLPAFVLDDLDEQQATQVQAHLAECSRCACEVKRLETLLTYTAWRREGSAGHHLCESARQNVLRAATQTTTEKPRPVQESGGALIWRLVMRSGTTRLAAAALIGLAIVLSLSLFTGSGAGTAYAQVVDRLYKAQTMTFSVVNKSGLVNMPTVRTQIAFKAPGLMRITSAEGPVMVARTTAEGLRGVNLIPSQKMYGEFELSNVSKNPNAGPYMSVEALLALPAEADELLGQAEIDGRQLEGYRVHQADTTITVWIDPVTSELARAELKFATAPGMDMILTDFAFDVALPDSLFSMEPPADYTPLGPELQADASSMTEADLIAFLRFWSTWTVDHVFPPTVNGPELSKITMQMAAEGKFVGAVAPGYDGDQQYQIMFRGMAFMSGLPFDTWRYAGQNVAFGDPDTPIFWYRPEGSPTYRVIYGDLSVADVPPEEIPN